MRALVGRHAVGVEQVGLELPRREVPVQRHRRDRQVGPPIGDAEVAEVDVPAAPAVVADQGVGCARVAVADHQPVGGRRVGGYPRLACRTGRCRPAARRASGAARRRWRARPSPVGRPSTGRRRCARAAPPCAATPARTPAPAGRPGSHPPSAAGSARRAAGRRARPDRPSRTPHRPPRTSRRRVR